MRRRSFAYEAADAAVGSQLGDALGGCQLAREGVERVDGGADGQLQHSSRAGHQRVDLRLTVAVIGDQEAVIAIGGLVEAFDLVTEVVENVVDAGLDVGGIGTEEERFVSAAETL